MSTEVMTQVLVEKRILELCDELEEQVEFYSQISQRRAEAESDFKYRFARTLIEQTAKAPVATKEAIAQLKASGEYREWKLYEARERATQQKLTSIRTQLDSLRTISANVRAAGG